LDVVDGVRYPERDSPYANPFKVGKQAGGSREEVLMLYDEYLDKNPHIVQQLKDELLVANPKISCLGCWCAPEACHGDLLLKRLSSLIINHK
jgi:hypothetical protein